MGSATFDTPSQYSERGKKTRQTEEEVGRQQLEMDRPGVRQGPEGSEEQGKMEKTGCKIICGAPTTLAVKGLMMMMMNQNYHLKLCLWCVMTSPATPRFKWKGCFSSTSAI